MIGNDKYSSTQYFGTLGPTEAAGTILDKVKRFDDYLVQSGRAATWRRSYLQYNRGIFNTGTLLRTGEQNEFTQTSHNHFRNVLTHVLNMVCSQPPTLEARAINTDAKSQSQTIVAKNILEYYARTKGMNEVVKKATEDALVYGDGWVYQGWDYTLGQPYIYDGQKVQNEGDVLHKNFTPYDVIFDFTATLRGCEPQWYVLRDYVNKWELVARFPEMREKILSFASSMDTGSEIRTVFGWNQDSDYVPVFNFFHLRNDILPEGRILQFCNNQCWFIDSALPKFYKKVPLHRMLASEQRQTGFGYSMAFDLLEIQENLDGLASTIVTNQATFGVQNILIPSGSNISVSALDSGLNVIEYSPNLPEPKPLNLLATAPEIFAYKESLEHTMEILSGVNSVTRGNPESSLKSGTALALVQSMAIQFINGLQQSYVQLLESVGTGLLDILKNNANTPRIIEITGINNKSYLKQFTKDDISEINRVVVDVGNPLARTIAGKVNIADNLLNAGKITDADQYIQMITTGNLDVMLENKQSEMMLIRGENESMLKGETVPVLIFDNHPVHIREHKAMLASPEARSNPAIVQIFLQHIQEHAKMANVLAADPMMSQLLGINIPVVAPTPNGNVHTGNELIPNDPTQATASKIRQPNLPKNPLTGE